MDDSVPQSPAQRLPVLVVEALLRFVGLVNKDFSVEARG